jgi:hypothetical protein
MIDIPLHKSKKVRIKARTNEASVPQVFKFRNEDRSPHNISAYDFEIPVYKRSNSTVKLFTLRIGSGLTVQGDDEDELLIEVTNAQAVQTADTYFWKLRSRFEDHTWLAGPWEFFNGEEDAEPTEEEITIAANGDTVIIEIVGPQSSTSSPSTSTGFNIRADHDASGDVFPAAPTGSGTNGAIKRFDLYPVSEGGFLDFGDGLQEVPEKSFLIFWGDEGDDTTDGTNWRLL